MIFGFLALIILVWIASPFLLIWAINTLFHTSYAISTFWEWLAAALLCGPFFHATAKRD